MATRKDVQALIDRWLTPDYEPVLHEVATALAGASALDAISLRTPEGRADLRGFTFPTPKSDPLGVYGHMLVSRPSAKLTVHDAAVHHVDFSHATMPNWHVMNAEFVDCIFDEADCHSWGMWQTDVTNCSFRGTNLRDSLLGSILKQRPNIWTDCDLTAADLTGAILDESQYHRVRFDHAQFDMTSLSRVTLEQCTFAGHLHHVNLDGNAAITNQASQWWLDQIDFSRCTVDAFYILNYDLATVQLPAGVLRIPDGHHAYPRIAERIRSYGQPGTDDIIDDLLGRAEERHWSGGDGAIHPADYGDHAGIVERAIREVVEA